MQASKLTLYYRVYHTEHISAILCYLNLFKIPTNCFNTRSTAKFDLSNRFISKSAPVA